MKFRKKPVVVEAEQLLWTNWGEVCELTEGVTGTRGLAPKEVTELFPEVEVDVDTGDPLIYMLIPTLEGDHLATQGDWIIKGVNGELYPCKPDIFEKTYEPVEGPAVETPAPNPVNARAVADETEKRLLNNIRQAVAEWCECENARRGDDLRFDIEDGVQVVVRCGWTDITYLGGLPSQAMNGLKEDNSVHIPTNPDEEQ